MLTSHSVFQALKSLIFPEKKYKAGYVLIKTLLSRGEIGGSEEVLANLLKRMQRKANF
jgi:hypothetical protein